MGCCSSVWYCTEDGPIEVELSGDPATAEPPEGWDGKPPHLTEEDAEAACPTPVEMGGLVECCERELTAVLNLTLSGGGGTVVLTWNGTYWEGSTTVSAQTVIFRFFVNCALSSHCAITPGSVGNPTPGTLDCGPPFSRDFASFAGAICPGSVPASTVSE